MWWQAFGGFSLELRAAVDTQWNPSENSRHAAVKTLVTITGKKADHKGCLQSVA